MTVESENGELERVRVLIEKEVAKDVAPIVDEDPEMAEWLAEVQRDYRTREYLFLRWIDREFFPKRILYPGSGSDTIPRIAFGQDRVVHTSLESYKENDIDYFPILGMGHKIVADFSALPFGDGTFQLILFANLDRTVTETYLEEILRSMEKNGLLVLITNYLDVDTNDLILPEGYERIEIPGEFQKPGEAEVRFTVYRKRQVSSHFTGGEAGKLEKEKGKQDNHDYRGD